MKTYFEIFIIIIIFSFNNFSCVVGEGLLIRPQVYYPQNCLNIEGHKYPNGNVIPWECKGCQDGWHNDIWEIYYIRNEDMFLVRSWLMNRDECLAASSERRFSDIVTRNCVAETILNRFKIKLERTPDKLERYLFIAGWSRPSKKLHLMCEENCWMDDPMDGGYQFVRNETSLHEIPGNRHGNYDKFLFAMEPTGDCSVRTRDVKRTLTFNHPSQAILCKDFKNYAREALEEANQQNCLKGEQCIDTIELHGC